MHESIYEFHRRRLDARFYDIQLTDLGLFDTVSKTRQSAWDALKIFGGGAETPDHFVMTSLPVSLSEEERAEVKLGCYEMLLVLADALAQPLPGEKPAEQARRASAILDCAGALNTPPSRVYYLRRADCLEKAGLTDRAQEARATARSIEPKGPAYHFLSGLESYKRGLLTDARQHLAAALHEDPSHFWAQCVLAICDLNGRPAHPAEAKIHLTNCLQSHPELPWLYVLRGFALGQLGAECGNQQEAAGHYQNAEADFNEALKRDPTGEFRYALLTDRGLVRFYAGRLDLARADLDEAIALHPRQMSAYVTLAQICKKEHKLEPAIELLSKAIALKPDAPHLYRTRAGWTLERPGPPAAVRAAALADLDLAIARGSPGGRDLALDYAEKGRLLLGLERYAEALDACEAARRINPDNAEVHRLRAATLLELGRFDEAIAACTAALRAGRQSAELLGLRGLARAKYNDFAGAIDDYTRALAAQPSNSLVHARRGWAYLVSGAPKLALRDFDEAIKIDSTSADAYCGRGSASVALGQYRDAVADAELALRQGSPDARTMYSSARILAQAADIAKKESRARVRTELVDAKAYQDRALSLLAHALELTSPGRRQSFWREVVRGDTAFSAIRRLPDFARLDPMHASTSP